MSQKSYIESTAYNRNISVSRDHSITDSLSIFLFKYGDAIGYTLWFIKHFKQSTAAGAATTTTNKYATSAIVNQPKRQLYASDSAMRILRLSFKWL